MVWVASVGVGRRQALAGLGGVAGAGLLGAVAAGCTGPSAADDDSTRTPAAPSSADAEADQETLDAATGLTLSLVSLIGLVTERHPGLRRQLRPLRSMHEAHLEVLTADTDDESHSISTPGSPKSPKAAARARLLDLCVEARSGPFAQLLAGMAAGIATYAGELGWDLPEDPE